jgi:hypothetical protein
LLVPLQKTLAAFRDDDHISALPMPVCIITTHAHFSPAYVHTVTIVVLQEILAACCDELMTIAIAPHQVYGPRDTLFLPK